MCRHYGSAYLGMGWQRGVVFEEENKTRSLLLHLLKKTEYTH